MELFKKELKKIIFVIKINHTLNTRNNFAVGRTIICTNYLNEDKGMQE